jgi:hypothetical protein
MCLQRAEAWRQSLDLVRVARAVRALCRIRTHAKYFPYVCATDLPACTLLLAQHQRRCCLLCALCAVRLHPRADGHDGHSLAYEIVSHTLRPPQECASIFRMLCRRSSTCRAAWHQMRHKRRCCSARLRLRADGHDADLLARCIMSRTLCAPNLPPKQM